MTGRLRYPFASPTALTTTRTRAEAQAVHPDGRVDGYGEHYCTTDRNTGGGFAISR
jgi:hypothetical protein